MNKILDQYCKLLNFLMVVCLAGMVVMVFGNVVLRYGFSSGITISEELSRWLFVWLTFFGAVIAVREHGHLGTDFLVARLPLWARKLCLLISYCLMLYVCYLLFQGAWAQTLINQDVLSPAGEFPVAIFYFTGVFFSISAAIMIVFDLWRLLSGKMADDELIAIKESEEQSSATH